MDVRNERGTGPVDVVRTPATSLARCDWAIAPRRCTAVRPRRCATNAASPALAAPLPAAAPWSRRRPVTVACCGGVWEWEAAQEDDGRITGAHRDQQQWGRGGGGGDDGVAALASRQRFPPPTAFPAAAAFPAADFAPPAAGAGAGAGAGAPPPAAPPLAAPAPPAGAGERAGAGAGAAAGPRGITGSAVRPATMAVRDAT
jgi:hypothetical protein